MNKSTGDIAKTRKKRPPATGTPLLVRLQPPDLSALDAYVSSAEPMSRPQAVRVILADWLRTHGFGGSNHSKPNAPATDVVEAMDAAIKKNRGTKEKP